MKTKSNGCTGKLPNALKSRASNIVRVVLDEFGIDEEALFGGDRKPLTCWARWVMFKQLRALGMTCGMVGNYAGYNHSSVSYGVVQLNTRLGQCDPEYDALRMYAEAVDSQLA